MTPDDWFERMEREMAGWAEERRKNAEESRQLLEETQRKLDLLANKPTEEA